MNEKACLSCGGKGYWDDCTCTNDPVRSFQSKTPCPHHGMFTWAHPGERPNKCVACNGTGKKLPDPIPAMRATAL